MTTAIAELPERERELAESEWPFHVGLVALTDQVVDERYQRPEITRFVRDGAANFDPTLVGTLDVTLRDNGTYAIIDGRQRHAMMREVGKTACYCSIYPAMSLEDEAGFFFRKNRDRQSMKPFYGFRARCVAGDREALAIQAAVEATGFVLGASPDDRDTLSAIRAAELAYSYSSPHRSESLTPTLVTIRDSVYGRKGSLDAHLLQSLGRFWQTYSDEEAEIERAEEVLAELGPINFLGNAKERQAQQKALSRPYMGALVLAEEYNRKLRAGRRGGPYPGMLDLSRITRVAREARGVS